MKYSFFSVVVLGLILGSQTSFATDKVEAAVGGGVGGAVGAVVGEELGGRNGAIVGAGVGAAVGAAIATENGNEDKRNTAPKVEVVVQTSHRHPEGYHCPPGQAKKGRC
jgi:outer membrane lipoprotein SlyB